MRRCKGVGMCERMYEKVCDRMPGELSASRSKRRLRGYERVCGGYERM